MISNIDREFQVKLNSSKKNDPYIGKPHREVAKDVLKNKQSISGPYMEVRTHGRREVKVYYLRKGELQEIRHFYITSEYRVNRMNLELTFCGNVKRWWVG
jgi:hypothetical protein